MGAATDGASSTAAPLHARATASATRAVETRVAYAAGSAALMKRFASLHTESFFCSSCALMTFCIAAALR